MPGDENERSLGEGHMKDKTHEEQLDELNGVIAKSREELAALSAGLRRLSEWKSARSPAEWKVPAEVPTNGVKPNGAWTGFRHTLEEAGTKSNAAAKGLAAEIERHPLLASIAAFGTGFAIAKLLFKRTKRHSNH
jgi:uncharacterized coiled-coil protein SlyX